MIYIFCRLILLNKLLEDGNTLFRSGRLEAAAYRYEYALKRLPRLKTSTFTHDNSNTKNLRNGKGSNKTKDNGNVDIFSQLKAHLLLNLSRTRRKQKVIAISEFGYTNK